MGNPQFGAGMHYERQRQAKKVAAFRAKERQAKVDKTAEWVGAVIAGVITVGIMAHQARRRDRRAS